MDEIIISPIKDDDIRSCLEIYNYYITDTTVTFEEEPLTYESFFERVNRICKTYPYFAAQVGGKTVGYAYLDMYNERSAYRHTADLSIYLNKDAKNRGIGSMLLSAVENAGRDRGINNIISLITEENERSVAFHEKHGYILVGKLNKVGLKFNKRLDVLIYQKEI